MTIAVALTGGLTFACSATVLCPNYPTQPGGEFFLGLVAAAGDEPAFAFSSQDGSIVAMNFDATAGTLSLAFLMAAQDSVNLAAGTYTGALVYVDGSGAIQAGDSFAFTVTAAAPGVTLPSAPSYGSIAGWGTITDIAGASTATTLQMLPRGLPGPVGPPAWSPIAAWAPYTAYQAGPPASLVAYGFSCWVCVTSHTSGAAFDPSKWQELAPGTNSLVASAQAAAVAAAQPASTLAIAAALAALTSTQLAALAAALVPVWLNSLQVYSGSGPAPVATGNWFINDNGSLVQAQ